MRRFLVLLFACVCGMQARSETTGGDAAAGGAHYGSCIACHGTQGEGNVALGAPVIAGLDATYIERQLTHYRNGIRAGSAADAQAAQMLAMARALPDARAVADVAAYVATLAPPRIAAPAGDLRNGNNQYQGKCGACHGGRAEGNAALAAPRLAAQHPEYLRRQYAAFLDGSRGAHASDRFGRQMRMMAATMSAPKDLDDVLAWIGATGETQ